MCLFVMYVPVPNISGESSVCVVISRFCHIQLSLSPSPGERDSSDISSLVQSATAGDLANRFG